MQEDGRASAGALTLAAVPEEPLLTPPMQHGHPDKESPDDQKPYSWSKVAIPDPPPYIPLTVRKPVLEVRALGATASGMLFPDELAVCLVEHIAASLTSALCTMLETRS